MILDRSYNYHANNLCQQVAPIDIYVKKRKKKKKKTTTTIKPLIYSQQTFIYTFVYVSILIVIFTWSESEKEDNTILIYDTVSFQGASEEEKNVANNVVSHICPDR